MVEWWQTHYCIFVVVVVVVVSFLFYSEWIVSKAWHKSKPDSSRGTFSTSDLTALRSLAWPQRGSWRRGWGWSRMWGTLTWCQAPGRSERRSGCPCAEPSSWGQGCSGATVLKVQQTARVTTWSSTLQTLYKSDNYINHRYPVCTCTIQFQLRFWLKLCTSPRRLSSLVG